MPDETAAPERPAFHERALAHLERAGEFTTHLPGREITLPAEVLNDVISDLRYLLAERARQEWPPLADGSLVVLRMPHNSDVDAFAHGATQLHQFLNRHLDEGMVHVVVLERDTELGEVDEDVMAQAGWVRAH